MQKTCRQCQNAFEITAEDLAFYDKISPVFNGKKYLIPPPTLCPECRQQRRLAFRNERFLYQRKCDLCRKEIIALYSEEKKYTVYCQQCWWSDKLDPMEYGQNYDFNQAFFPQFWNLKKKVPRIALYVSNNENSEFINMSGYNKNCYLIFAGEYNENCLYGTQVIKSQQCLDTLCCLESEGCYEVVDVEKCYKLFLSRNCKSCNDSMFLFDCRSCSDCMFCSNIRNKKYNIFNKQYSKEEYEKKKHEFFCQISEGKLPQLLDQFDKFVQQSIHKNLEIQNGENIIGNYILDARNVYHCFDFSHGQDCRYVTTAFNVKDIVDVAHVTDAELAYECTSLGYRSYGVCFANVAWSCGNAQYIDNVHNSSDVFGCVGLKRNKYCILNKQYLKEEYEKVVPLIIERMYKDESHGEFFPAAFSPFGYNETVAQDYFPLTREKTLAKGFQWKDQDEKKYVLQTFQVSKNINDTLDSIVKEILACIECEKNYRIIIQELKFYRTSQLPIPQKCPDCRHKARMSLRNPRHLWQRTCDKCRASIQTTYAPDRPEIVYCEQCYLKEVY